MNIKLIINDQFEVVVNLNNFYLSRHEHKKGDVNYQMTHNDDYQNSFLLNKEQYEELEKLKEIKNKIFN